MDDTFDNEADNDNDDDGEEIPRVPRAAKNGAGKNGAAAASGGGGGRGGASGGGGVGGSGGASGGGGVGGSGGADTDGGPPCTPPYDTAAHCGSCRFSCDSGAPICSLGTDGYFCTVRCAAPLIECGTQCVNPEIDENNCGRCNRRCVSGICQGSQCVGATAGHAVLFCMDYRTRAIAGAPQEKLLENAIFLGPRSTVRVLAYAQYTPQSVITAVGSTLDAAAQARGRSYTLTSGATSLDVANSLNVFSYDVLLVYDQSLAPAGRLASIGTGLANAVDSFTRAGGTVVVLAGDGGRGEMSDLITNAGLLDVSGQTSVTGALVYDRGLADAIGINVLTPFRASRETCTFATPPPDSSTVFVVTDAPSSAGRIGAAVVVHRVVAP